MKKHGTDKRRTWRKLHLAVDVDTHEAISAEVSLVNIGDSGVEIRDWLSLSLNI